MWYNSEMAKLKETTRKDYTERILKVLRYIQKHLDKPVSLDELASVACFSPYHFHRIFRGMVGESVKGHIRRLRLERAASRLKNGQRSVTQIAFEAGYETHEAFTRAFGKIFGVAPQKFRLSHRTFTIENSGIHYCPDDELQQFNPDISENMTMKVKVMEFESVKVAYVRHVGPYNQCCTAWEKLCAWAGPRGLLQPGCRFLGLCYDDPEVTPPEKIRYDACITIDDDIEPEGEIGMQTISKGTYAMITHFGPYENLSKTYCQLCGQWAPENGYEIASKPTIEIYQNSPEDTDPKELITDVHVPLETK